MKVDVVVEMVGGCVEDVTVHLSETTATKHIKKWFKKNYSIVTYDRWKAGSEDFEFDLKHEIYHFETEVLGPTGQDICKGCREKVIE